MSDDDLTTITLTFRERCILARALGDDTRALMDLWSRVQPDGAEV